MFMDLLTALAVSTVVPPPDKSMGFTNCVSHDMSVQYLLDENLPPLYQEQLLRYQSDLTVLMFGDAVIDVQPNVQALMHDY